MYQKVLVPLDGSVLAECALPEVMKLYKGGVVGEVIILKVDEIEISTIPKAYARSVDVAGLKKAQATESNQYLKSVQSRLKAEGIKVSTELLAGSPEEMIVDYAKNRSVDLIIIATHGYSGMKRLMFGSVALQILHDANVPILLIRAQS